MRRNKCAAAARCTVLLRLREQGVRVRAVMRPNSNDCIPIFLFELTWNCLRADATQKIFPVWSLNPFLESGSMFISRIRDLLLLLTDPNGLNGMSEQGSMAGTRLPFEQRVD